MAFAAAMTAQDRSRTEANQEPASQQVKVERGEVVYVSGNELVVKTENGEVRHFTVPESYRITVDGQQLSVHELKPGMKLQRTITTTTASKLVTTVRTIQGKVFHVSAPASVILTLPDGTNKQYKVPKDQKFMIGGQEKTVFELRKGMTVSATVVTQVPETVVAQQRKVTGSAPPPPPTPQIEGALLIEETPAPPKQVAAAAPAPAPQASAAEPAPKHLPKTGSPLPLVGLLGLLSLVLSFGVKMFRRSY
jgi:LPXTG-motif cell wall-anchored protein